MKVGVDDILVKPNGSEKLRQILADGGERIPPDVWQDINQELTYEPIDPFPMDAMPPVEVIGIEVPDPLGPYGAKGVGEVGLVPTAAAVAGAFRCFDGRVRRSLPLEAV